jgi:hypothetical protein
VTPPNGPIWHPSPLQPSPPGHIPGLHQPGTTLPLPHGASPGNNSRPLTQEEWDQLEEQRMADEQRLADQRAAKRDLIRSIRQISDPNLRLLRAARLFVRTRADERESSSGVRTITILSDGETDWSALSEVTDLAERAPLGSAISTQLAQWFASRARGMIPTTSEKWPGVKRGLFGGIAVDSGRDRLQSSRSYEAQWRLGRAVPCWVFPESSSTVSWDRNAYVRQDGSLWTGPPSLGAGRSSNRDWTPSPGFTWHAPYQMARLLEVGSRPRGLPPVRLTVGV